MARIFENGIGSGSYKASRRFLGTTALTAAGLALLSPNAQAQDHAWTNFDTQHGSISTDISIPNTTNITQHSDLYIGNSNNLDILGHQTVNIGQNGAGSLFVARSTREGEDPTRILGALNANGGVMVIDRNGVFMGPDSSVDVGKIVVSTGNVSNEDLINGYDAGGQYTFDNFGDGKIELNGTINVAPDHGLAGFVSPTVINNGIINAKMGKVVMAGAEKVTLDLYGDNLVEIAVEDKAAAALLENNGRINAEGGTVIMTAQAARGVVDNVINVSGIINASSATVQGGKIILGGGEAGKVEVSGSLIVSGRGGAGSINVTGEDIEVSEDAKFRAAATITGDGGDVYVYATNNALFEGLVQAYGGSQGGNGGTVEISAANQLGYNGSVYTKALTDTGTSGTFLLDPLTATIDNGSLHGPLGAVNYIINAQALANDMGRNGSVTVQADNVINVGTATSGPIDLANYNYVDEYMVTTLGGLVANHWAVASGINTGNLTLDSNTVNFNDDLTIGRGNLTVDANTVNLDGKLYGYGTAPSMTTALLGDARISSNAGAVNVLSDDASIQQGIWLANDAGGATVDVAAGHYVQDSSIVINKGVTLQGAQAGVDARLESGIRTAGGAGETIIDFGGGVRQVLIESDDVVIDGFEITNATEDGNDLIYANTKPGAAGNRWTGLAIRNNIIHNGGDEGIQLRDVDGAIIEYNNIFNMTGDGINIADESKDSFIRFNEIYDTRSTNGQIYVYRSDNITIEGNYIHDITAGNDGIKLGLDNFGDSHRFVGNVLNNRIDNVAQDGIAVYSSGALISGNEISRSYSSNGAIHVQSTNSNLPTNVVIENNYIHDNSTRGIRVSEAVNLAIRNNIFENNTLGHVVVRNSVNDAGQITIFGNSFDSSGPFAVANEATGLLNASGNWWNTVVESEILDRTLGQVDITPYLASGTDADGDKTTGFQGDFSDLYVTLLGGQTGSVARIQEGVNMVDAGGTVRVNNGTYDENVLIHKSLSLLSVNGRDNTTITGSALRPGQGTIEIANGVDDVVIGDTGKGLHIVGFDGDPGQERAAIYVQGAHDGVTIRGNRITAAGDAAIATEWSNAVINRNMTIDGNIIDGVTYTGPYGDWGIGDNVTQFTVSNVPRQLVTLNKGHENLTFTNNEVIGDAGDRQLVSLESNGATVTGNDFDGRSTSAALRVRGSDITVADNTLTGEGLGLGIYAFNVNNLTIGGATSAEGNTVSGFKNGIFVDGGTGTILVQNNTATGNTDTGAGRTASNWTTGIGILISNLLGATVSDNTVTDNTDGIRVVNSDAATLGDLTVSGNTVTGNTDKGIILKDSNNILVSENTISGNDIGFYADLSAGAHVKGNTINSNTGGGIRLRGASGNALIENNFIQNNGVAQIYLDNGLGSFSGTKIFDNNIQGAKLVHNGVGGTVDASGNYWGTTDEAAILSKMTGGVDFTPYLALGTDTDSDATNGFQGDFSNLHVTLLGGQTGSTGRIQEGVNLVNVAGTVNVNAGTYTEGDINIHKALTVRGVNAATTVVDASGYTNGFVVDGNLGNRNAVLSYMTVKNAAQDGVLVKDTATMKFMQLNRMNIENNGYHGVALYGNGAQGLTILNSNFLDNGFGGGSRGEGDVLAYQHNGDVILRNVNIQNNSPAGLADYGVQIRGADTLAPGKVELDNVKISGSYRAAQLGIQRYDGLTLSMNNVVLGGQTTGGTDSAGWAALYLSELGGNALDIGNTAFLAHAGNYITLGIGSGYFTTNDVDATDATFEGISGATASVPQNFAIENKIFHKMDDAGQGLVTWHTGNLYVTGGGNAGKIQTAVDASDVNGTVHVDDSTYTENLLLHVDGLKLTGHGTTLQYDVNNSGRGVAGNLITVDADNVNIDPFVFDGGGVAMYGTYADGDAGLVIDGNTYQNFTQAGIYLNNTTDALVTGNTLNNTGIYGVLLTGGTGATIEGGSISNTLWDSIRVLSAGNTTIQNIALNNAGTSQDVNGVGSGIVFVNATGAKVDNATITNVARIGIYAGASSDIELVNNTITNAGTGTNTSHGDSIGKFSGIHVEGTNNLKVSNNTINGATKDGINLGGLINVPYAGAVTGVVTIDNNVIRNTGEDGIDVTGGTDVSITANHVGFTETAPDVFAPAGAGNIKGDGIRVVSSNGADINDNFIDGVSKNGIYVQQGTGIDILGNNLNRIGQVGIYTNQVNTLGIARNDMDNVGWQGIQVEGGSAATVDENIIRKAGGRGIAVSGTNGSTVSDNTVYNIGESGIVVNGGKNAAITGNVVYTVGTKGAGNWDGIQSNGVGENLSITGNFIGHTNKSGAVGGTNNIRNDGIDVTNGATVTIADNVIDRVGNYGIKAHTIGALKITDNTVGVQSAQILRGIDIDSTTNAEVIGNTLDNMLTYGLFGNAVNGLKFYDNDVTGVTNAMGTGVRLTNTSNAQIGNSDQTTWVSTGPWPWQGYFQTTDRDNRISDLNMGVEIVGGDNNQVVNNTISNVHNGVKLTGSTNAYVLDNTITGNSVTGIDVTAGSHGAYVGSNTLTTFATGINVVGSSNVTVVSNALSDVLNGIVATGAHGLRVRANDLTGRGNVGTGIDVTASDDVIIGGYDLVSLLGMPVYQGNAVEDFQNGINADGVTLLKIQGNRVEGTGSTGTGIKVTNSNGAEIGGDGSWLSFFQSNYVTGFWDGIQSNNSNDVKIVRNTVEDSDGDGIRVDSVNATNDVGVQVLRNRVNNVGRTGIWVKNQNNILVDDNRVDGTTSFSGIRAEGGNGVTISNNRSNNTGTHGVSANGVTNLNILANFIGMHGGNIGADGINVVNSGGAEILQNRIDDTAGEGVYVEGSAASHVVQNQINNTGSHAIHLHNSANSFAQVNFIGQLGGAGNINGDGIQFSGNSQGGTITGNRIANIGSPADGIGSGISVKGNVTGTQIGGPAGPQANIINDVAWDGIRVESTAGAGTGVQILNNDITTAGRVGIWAKNTVGAQINDNDIVDTGLSGIRGEGGSNLSVLRNTIDDTGTHGISTDGVLGLISVMGNQIGQNIVDAIMGNGIYVMNAENVNIGAAGADANLVRGAQNGIEVDGATGLITVDSNIVDDSRGVGILFSGGTNGDVVLTGNALTDNVTGMGFQSGRIDLTGLTNTITGGTTGMLFDRFGGVAPLSMVAGAGDIPGTNGTFGTTTFTGQSGQYIVLANNAFSNGFNSPIWLDASYATFDGFTPNSKPRDVDGIPLLSLAEYNALESKITHFNDSGWLGLILFGKLPTIDQEELFRTIDFGAFGASGLNVRILGLPSIPGSPSGASFNNIAPFAGGGTSAAALNNLTPAAGGEFNPADLNNIAPAAGGNTAPATPTQQQATAQQLNQIDTASGGEDVSCWNDAMNVASTGQAVNLSYGGGMDDVLNGAAACGSAL